MYANHFKAWDDVPGYVFPHVLRTEEGPKLSPEWQHRLLHGELTGEQFSKWTDAKRSEGLLIATLFPIVHNGLVEQLVPVSTIWNPFELNRKTRCTCFEQDCRFCSEDIYNRKPGACCGLVPPTADEVEQMEINEAKGKVQLAVNNGTYHAANTKGLTPDHLRVINGIINEITASGNPVVRISRADGPKLSGLTVDIARQRVKDLVDMGVIEYAKPPTKGQPTLYQFSQPKTALNQTLHGKALGDE